MSTDEQRRSTRRRQWLIAGALLSLACLIAGVDRYFAHQRLQRTLSELEVAGGAYHLGPTTWERLLDWLHDDDSGETWIMFQDKSCDNAWVRDHDYLADLSVESLLLDESPLHGADLAKLIETHPLTSFDATGLQLSPEVVTALAGKAHLKQLVVSGSSLTDADLRRFPLEQMNQVQVAETRVTANGVLELQRCRRLRSLCVDADQLSEEVIEMIRSMPSLRLIMLQGEEVNDGHLATLQDVATLKVFFFRDTSITTEAVKALRTARPGVQIEIVGEN